MYLCCANLCANSNALFMKRFLLLLLLVTCSAFSAVAQQDAYRQYIDTYSAIAIDQMIRYRIPASITLAQGIIESNAGRSTLATQANNHFGIKTGGTWTGPYMLRDDDAPNEQFRKYKNVSESYEDHSLFSLSADVIPAFSNFLSPTTKVGRMVSRPQDMRRIPDTPKSSSASLSVTIFTSSIKVVTRNSHKSIVPRLSIIIFIFAMILFISWQSEEILTNPLPRRWECVPLV